MGVATESRARGVLSLEGLDAMLRALRGDGYEILGPTVRDGAIVYDRIEGRADLPEGIGDDQTPGNYRLKKRGDGALFGYAVGPHSYKREFLVPKVRLFRVRKSANGPAVETDPAPDRKLAILGARACDLAAIGVQDRVLMEGPYPDADYVARRRGVFVIAVNCGEPAGTCFCASMGTGPRVTAGHDVVLTELCAPVHDGGDLQPPATGVHRFVAEAGTEAGAALLERVGLAPLADGDLEAVDAVVQSTASRMGRRMETRGIRELLQDNPEHPRWDDVASRCLGCTNCTLVCPTCFCTTVEDTTDLGGEVAERHRRWDSCFTLDFSHVHGGSVRTSLKGRYRQWMTHKLSTWFDQFGTSGCVGCGRCITWCPVGIDITEEAAAIRGSGGG